MDESLRTTGFQPVAVFAKQNARFENPCYEGAAMRFLLISMVLVLLLGVIGCEKTIREARNPNSSPDKPVAVASVNR